MSSTARRHIGSREHQARLVHRQLLDPARRTASVREATGAVLALHATDAATVYLSAVARLAEPLHETVEREL